jgi:hypothetical protein
MSFIQGAFGRLFVLAFDGPRQEQKGHFGMFQAHFSTDYYVEIFEHSFQRFVRVIFRVGRHRLGAGP